MQSVNVKELIDLLNNGKSEEAEKRLEIFFKSSLTPEEKGEALVSLASMHMEIVNSKNRQYLELLDNAIMLFKNLEKQEQKLEDNIDLNLARHQIGHDSKSAE
jgi:hypothetical protein